MPWTWDPDKAKVNRAKHGLSFETAALVFDDPLHASKQDPHPDGDRWHTHRTRRRGLAACCPYLARRNRGRRTHRRIISARKATAHERKAYEEGSF
ncbi:BrnT family toxin [Bradyrhizobium sp.]|uniref:BrnT family toxin n=1 Tax=Bradyrhizobium sp. TaxID=376 RepID=UPI001ECCF0EC|nr:BrnT family toxin [Bradyrhizobium sp.]MBV9979854.1 BrnT family toxin [Bradyrhizobium sp.]